MLVLLSTRTVCFLFFLYPTPNVPEITSPMLTSTDRAMQTTIHAPFGSFFHLAYCKEVLYDEMNSAADAFQVYNKGRAWKNRTSPSTLSFSTVAYCDCRGRPETRVS